MNTKQRVAEARSPQDALLAIAESLDALAELIVTQDLVPADPWAAWPALYRDALEDGRVAYETAYQAKMHERDEAAIAAVKEQLAIETDGEAVQALQARLRLLEEDGGTVPPPPEGERVQSVVSDTNVTIDIPPPDDRRRAARRKIAGELRFHEFLTASPFATDEEFIAAYVKGGPMWLYLGDRDAVMAMPGDYRRLLIADIEQDSAPQAQDVARDILKDVGPGDPDTNLGRLYQ
jgi:hypothetical protein